MPAMRYSFDKEIDRNNTSSMKWDFKAAHGHKEDILPLWLADMDFAAPPAVSEAMRAVADFNVYGYANITNAYFTSVQNWFTTRHGYSPRREWLVFTPGIVFALATAIRALTAPGDNVLIQPPVYYPFANMVKANGRRLFTNPLIYRDGRYEIDFDDFARKIQHAKLFILCSPHNPVGRVWHEEELLKMGGLCLQHGVPVICDEIHCDFVYEGHRHHVFPTVDKRFGEQCVLMSAPSKTFNLAGLQSSNIFVQNKMTRARIQKEIDRTGAGLPNVAGLAATQAAYAHGAPWLDELISYLADSVAIVRRRLRQGGRGVTMVKLEGTYLAWLDCKALCLDDDALDAFMAGKAGLWLSRGDIFGKDGSGFMRMNLASPHAVITRAMDQLTGALSARGQ
jgi:cystathionine beta-lyase